MKWQLFENQPYHPLSLKWTASVYSEKKPKTQHIHSSTPSWKLISTAFPLTANTCMSIVKGISQGLWKKGRPPKWREDLGPGCGALASRVYVERIKTNTPQMSALCSCNKDLLSTYYVPVLEVGSGIQQCVRDVSLPSCKFTIQWVSWMIKWREQSN